MAHATVSPTAELVLPWRADFNALVYVLSGNGYVGEERRPVTSGHLALFGPGDLIKVGAGQSQSASRPQLEVLVLGGLPIREPVVHYGPFVMNSREEIAQALEDYQAGRLGQIPAQALPHRRPRDVEVAADK
jgi:redox-sensitive bicupin YhaK (pirin superfamily)